MSSTTDAPAASSTVKKVVLQSSDGETFEVEETVVLQCQAIKQKIEDDITNTTIPLPKITSNILAKVIEYCKRHVEKEDGNNIEEEKALKTFDEEFVKVDHKTLFDLILAANDLNIKSLLDLTCQIVADMIKSMSSEKIRESFNIKDGFTPEEVRRENVWAFE